MSIGERIRFVRNMRGMTQKCLGIAVGFDEKSANIRVAQYEAGARKPKDKLLKDFARVLEVSLEALNEPDLNSHVGLMHLLFTLEDQYGLKIGGTDKKPILTFEPAKGADATVLHMLGAWRREAESLEKGRISLEEYDDWRYGFPRAAKKRGGVPRAAVAAEEYIRK